MAKLGKRERAKKALRRALATEQMNNTVDASPVLQQERARKVGKKGHSTLRVFSGLMTTGYDRARLTSHQTKDNGNWKFSS